MLLYQQDYKIMQMCKNATVRPKNVVILLYALTTEAVSPPSWMFNA